MTESVIERLEALEARAKEALGDAKQQQEISRSLAGEARAAAAHAKELTDRAKASADAARAAAGQYRAEVDKLKQALAEVRVQFRHAEAAAGASSTSQALRRKWAVPVTQPLILISQLERSGGTLLGRLFDGHRECFVHPHELKWGSAKSDWPSFETHAAVDADAIFTELDAEWSVKFLVRGGYYKSMQGDKPDLFPFVFDVEVQRAVFRDVFARRRPDNRRDILDAFLTSIFNGWLDYQNLYSGPKKFVAAFLPRLVMMEAGVDRFFQDYPDGHLLTLVRHPGAWLASMERHRRTEVTLGEWHASVRASLAAQAAYPDRVTIVLFEDLVLETAATMQMICERTGLTFERVLLEPTFNGIPASSDSSFVSVKGIDPAVITRYRDVLRPGQLAAVEAALPSYREIARGFGHGRHVVP